MKETPLLLLFKKQSLPHHRLFCNRTPFLGFVWVGSLDMSHFFVKHPIVKLVKRFFGSSRSVIVRPSANDGIEFPQDFLHLPSTNLFPFLLHLVSVFLNSFFARFGQQFPSGFCV